MSPPALELPEILSLVAVYVHRRSLLTCALVSKTWYQVFNPLIWKRIWLDDKKPYPPTAIQSHAHLVKTIVVSHSPMGEYAAFKCPNLELLKIGGEGFVQDYMDMIRNHPHITHLSLGSFDPFPDASSIWDELIGFPYLRDLAMSEVDVHGENAETFWDLCTHLQRLDMCALTIQSQQGQLSSKKFSNLKDLVIWDPATKDIPMLFEFMQRCPNLATLDWITPEEDNALFVSGFTPLIAQKTWPHLHELRLGSLEMKNHDLLTILRSMERITAFEFPTILDALEEQSIHLLRPHFSYLTVLDMGTRQKSNIPFAQEILASCPLLEQLQAPAIHADAVVEGKPWVCLGLKKLYLSYWFNPSTIHHVQPIVFCQLAKLTRLQELRLWGFQRASSSSGVQFQEVDLRLENGLDALSTLCALHTLSITGTRQKMGEKEAEWIVQNWRSLEHVFGDLNERNAELNRALKARLREHGIT